MLLCLVEVYDLSFLLYIFFVSVSLESQAAVNMKYVSPSLVIP